jgi:flagellar biosynthesis/type III secretory pathway M-ring protein FliF/YscJ
MRKRKNSAVQVTGDRAVNAGDTADFEGQLASRAASQERLDTEALHALKLPAAGTKKSEVLAKHLKKAVKDDPAASAQLLRTWIHENET